MENNQLELAAENKRLAQTVLLAKSQLKKARQGNEENKEMIISAKKELRESASHSVSNLWSNEGFEALAEISQYVNPVLDKIASYEAAENKIKLLENLIRSPYFARIDFKFDDEDGFEKIYIGRSSLMKEDSYETVVYDWRSPIASIFYRFVTGPAFYDAPVGRITGQVGLKRQYEIKDGMLAYFFDADVQIVDEFLRKLLSQNASAKMKAIVETIQRQQDIVIRDMENDLLMVQGVAGSGKTSIALHRAAYLMYQDLSVKLSANNIIIISPNTLFEQYIAGVLPELGEDNVVSAVFEEIMAKILKTENIQSKNQFLENLITSAQQRPIKSSMEFKTGPLFMKVLNLFIDDLPRRFIEFEDICYNGQCIIDKEVLKDRILSGRKSTPLGVKLKQLEDFVLDEIQASQQEPVPKQDIGMIKRQMQAFTLLDIEALYKKCLWNKEYFWGLAKGLALPDHISSILDFTRENLDAPLLFYDDAAALTYLTLKINGANVYKNIKQVVIDEAQDYYPLHFEIFNLLFSNAKYTILGDINQTLEKQEDLSLYEQIAKILNKKKASLATMDKSFRCTNEILSYSGKFIAGQVEIKSFNRAGDLPAVYPAEDLAAMDDKILAEVNLCLKEGYRSIGLICKSEKNACTLFERLKNRFDVVLIKDRAAADIQGVSIIPVYMSKGLEFDAVLICDADASNYFTQEDKKLLYIACTRALHRLNLFCSGQPSPLI